MQQDFDRGWSWQNFDRGLVVTELWKVARMQQDFDRVDFWQEKSQERQYEHIYPTDGYQFFPPPYLSLSLINDFFVPLFY